MVSLVGCRQRIGLGEDAVGAGEVAGLARIDHNHWQVGGGQGGTTARSYPPVASSTMRAGSSACTRIRSSSRPPRDRGTVQASPLGCTATSRWVLATSMPRFTLRGAVIRYPPNALTARPTLRDPGSLCGPGNCSGSGPACGPGRPCSPTVSDDPGLVSLSRPAHCDLGHSKALGTYKGLKAPLWPACTRGMSVLRS